MTQVATAPNVVNLNNAVQTTPVRFWRDPIEFATFLVALKGPQFMAYDAVFSMDDDGRMVQKHRVTKLPNPYFGRGLVKEATTQVSVNFDYKEKVERREGEYSGKGTWHTAVLVNGKPSPLSVHKSDVTVADDGTQTFHDGCRLYLRCEIVRFGEGETRAEKSMRSTSRYVLPDGTEVAASDIEPYLKARSERKDETDFIVVTLSNISELRAGGVVWRKWTGPTSAAFLTAAVANA